LRIALVRTSALTLIFLASAHAHAQAPDPVPPDLGSSLMQLVGGLIIVVGLLLGTLWLIKRLSGPRGAASGLKVLGAAAVGTRERVVLVELADKVLVLGVTQNSVNTLHTLDAEEFRKSAGAPPQASATSFQGWFARALERRRGEG
jgi:flagellar protein FliO/FliZ